MSTIAAARAGALNGAVICLFACSPAFCAESSWKTFTSAESGFSVSMPTTPSRKWQEVAGADSTLLTYEASVPRPVAKYSVYVGMPKRSGIYEEAAMNAFLQGHLASMARAVGGTIIESKYATVEGHKALQYRFEYHNGTDRIVTRGFTVMLDGGHMRVSMAHSAEMPNADAAFAQFTRSFRLTPISFKASGERFSAASGVSVMPPEGWIQAPPKQPSELVFFTNLTRFISVVAANDSRYTCKNFETELKGIGRVRDVSSIMLGSRQFTKLVSYEDVPKHDVRLTSVQYCLDSKKGAVVLGGTEEERMFWRWAGVFEGSAATLVVD